MPAFSRTVTTIVSETEMQGSLITIGRTFDWLAYATFRSFRSEPGFPDIVFVKSPSVLFVEVKTEKGKLRKGRMNKAGSRWLPGQDDWGNALSDCPGVEYHLVRPTTYDDFIVRLMQ